MQRIDQLRTPLRAPARAMWVIAGVVGLAALGAAWGWATAPLRVAAPVARLDFSSDALARHVEAAFADADAATVSAVPGARPAEVVFFRGATSSVCVSGIGGRGVFYCPETGIAAFDLGYLESLVARLEADADLGVTLLAARLAAEHRQRETQVLDMAALDMIGAPKERRAEIRLGLALQADCLTGVWARAAEPSIGVVADGLWSRLIQSARGIARDFESAGRPIPPELDSAALGTREAREAAFRSGYADPTGAVCPAPVALAMR